MLSAISYFVSIRIVFWLPKAKQDSVQPSGAAVGLDKTLFKIIIVWEDYVFCPKTLIQVRLEDNKLA